MRQNQYLWKRASGWRKKWTKFIPPYIATTTGYVAGICEKTANYVAAATWKRTKKTKTTILGYPT
jgi:hypothetical protein